MGAKRNKPIFCLTKKIYNEKGWNCELQKGSLSFQGTEQVERRHIVNGDLAVVIFMANKTQEESHWWTNLVLVWHHVMGTFLYSHGIKSKRNVFGCDILTVP